MSAQRSNCVEVFSFSGQPNFFFFCFKRRRLLGVREPPSSSLSSSAHTNHDSFNSVLQCSVCVATHDNVGRVISHLNKGIEEERYTDAAFLRHKAGAGLEKLVEA
ncbi:hypothetical protein K1719_043199 [Acacia pycnantha]|nr:hypothetical protein K1719_043199 [Acacia pycnantha]